VQISRARSEGTRRFQVAADDLRDIGRHLLARDPEQRRARSRAGVVGRHPGGHRAFEEADQLVERELPQVTLIGDQRLEHRHGGRFATRGSVLDRPCHGRCVGERGVGQEQPDLEVRVQSGLDATIELEDEPVAEDDRRVALLRAAGGRLQARPAPRGQAFERGRR
jgi:hypothetical protein